MSDWNPDLYLRYRDERTQPSRDLVARIELARLGSIVDIGCGPGNSTQVLRDRWPDASVVGVDSSPEMIARAGEGYPGQRWVLADAATWEPAERFDLVFSNATLQWIPAHETLVPRLLSWVKPGGALAVQIPANSGSPLYQAIVRTAERPEWRGFMTGVWDKLLYRDAAFYYDCLASWAARLFVWETIYYHVMAGHRSLVEWYRSTGMRPYLERLPDTAARERFEDQVLDACGSDYPQQNDGKVLFPFKRLFFIAYRD